MKGNPKIIETMNALLADELTAVSQYMVHSEMCDDWGYARLHKAVEGRAKDEMRHAEMLIGRILFLEGKSTVSKINPMHIGNTVEDQLNSDHESEAGAVANYNAAIAQAGELGDHGTRDMLTSILKEEEAHIDWLEAQKDQIAQMGIQIYLSLQVKE
ncbi:MAG: bacterioferritin [Anaerolineales bacterium]|jgi:bacterioferritin